MSSRSTNGRGGRGSGRSQGRGNSSRGRGGRGGRGRTPSSQQPKFKGNCTELSGFIFDCTDYRQADTYVTTVKRIADYVGAEYKHGGDIRSSIVNEVAYVIPIPTTPTPPVDPAKPTPEETVASMIFKGELESYVKRKSILQDNLQKAYALVLGQCTELLQSKLKQQGTWQQVNTDQSVLDLLSLIKAITFKFDDQKFLPLALHEAKSSLYHFKQGNLTCHD